LYGALLRSRFKNQNAHEKYKKYRKKVTHLLEESKRNYYQSQFLSCENDSKKMWKLINNLLGSKAKELSPPEKLFDTVNLTYTCNHESMASIFNNYFVSIGKKLASTIAPPNISAYPVECSGPEQSFVLHETFTEEVIAVINSLIESKSTRQNDIIPVHILKLCKNVLSPFLEQIFNLCIKEGIYPQSLKCAEVVPIHKDG